MVCYITRGVPNNVLLVMLKSVTYWLPHSLLVQFIVRGSGYRDRKEMMKIPTSLKRTTFSSCSGNARGPICQKGAILISVVAKNYQEYIPTSLNNVSKEARLGGWLNRMTSKNQFAHGSLDSK